MLCAAPWTMALQLRAVRQAFLSTAPAAVLHNTLLEGNTCFSLILIFINTQISTEN